MKKLLRRFVLSLSVVAILWCCGCASVPKTSKVVARISQPPPGKALVNFHRPSSYAKPTSVPIFDINGKMLVDMRGNSLFQCVCDPGETVFIGWAEHVTVIRADLAPDKVYDVMVDVAPGTFGANIFFTPLTKNSPRRAKLAEFERREKWTIAINPDSPRVAEYEAKNRERIEQIKKDFLSGAKSDRAWFLEKYDCR